ncbi:hypothetical protein K0U07_00445 [bacterium]|nr:hypothetical protein [bacterium]
MDTSLRSQIAVEGVHGGTFSEGRDALETKTDELINTPLIQAMIAKVTTGGARGRDFSYEISENDKGKATVIVRGENGNTDIGRFVEEITSSATTSPSPGADIDHSEGIEQYKQAARGAHELADAILKGIAPAGREEEGAATAARASTPLSGAAAAVDCVVTAPCVEDTGAGSGGAWAHLSGMTEDFASTWDPCAAEDFTWLASSRQMYTDTTSPEEATDAEEAEPSIDLEYVKRLREQNDLFQKVNIYLAAQNEQLKAAAAAAEEPDVSLVRDLGDMGRRNVALEEEIHALEARLHSTQSRLEDAEGALAEEEELRLRTEDAELFGASETSEEEKSSLEATISNLEAEVRGLRREIDDQSRDLHEAEEAQGNVDELTEQLATSEQRIGELEVELAEKRRLENQIARLEADRRDKDQLEAGVARLQQMLNSKTQEILGLRGRIATITRAHRAQEAAAERLEATIRAQSEEIAALRSDRARLLEAAGAPDLLQDGAEEVL